MNLLMKEKMDLDTFINKAAIKPGRKELYTKRLAQRVGLSQLTNQTN